MSSQDSSLDEPLRKGTQFGRYSIIRLIAMGGMAEVYEAEHLDLQKRVAIKIIRPAFAHDGSLVQRFVLEARTASRLRHPNVIAVSDVGVERGRPYMVMEYLEGEDLSDAAHGDALLEVERIADIMLPVCSAVAAAHADGVLHRDLKPENIFLARDRAKIRPVLLDFGISRVVDKVDPVGRALTKFGQTVGTPFYMALEQLKGLSDLDSRADQYSLGVILYECATGRHPYNGDDLESLVSAIAKGDAPRPSASRPELPSTFDDLVMRAMNVERDARFSSVTELGRALWPFASPIVQAIWTEEFGVSVAPPPSKRTPPAPHLLRPSDLRSFPAFENCADADLDMLLTQSSSRRYDSGARILTQGAHGSGCFLLVSGEVQIVKSTSSGHWIVGTLRAGSVFGQIALVDHLPRTASVVAVGEVVVVHIARAVFDKLLADASELALALHEQIAVSGIRQLRHATKRFATILDRKNPIRQGSDPRRELVYVQVAASEWDLAIEGEDDL